MRCNASKLTIIDMEIAKTATSFMLSIILGIVTFLMAVITSHFGNGFFGILVALLIFLKVLFF